jgi:hypothetical protein
MKRVWLPGLAGLLGLALLAGSSFSADKPTTTDKQPTTNKQTTTNKADKHKHTTNKPVAPGAAMATEQTKQAAKTHLPPNFAKANLTPEQHEKAMAVMSKYASQIKELDTQIHALRAKRDGELASLLSDAQKKSLADAKAASHQARVEKKGALASKTEAKQDPQMRAFHEAVLAREAQIGEKLAEQRAAKEQAKNKPKQQPAQPEKTQPEKTQPEKK